MKQPINTVITGIKALYLQELISFNPEIIDINFKSGTNVKYYQKKIPKLKIKTMIPEFLFLYTEKIENFIVYSKERLFVEIDNFEIDEILKKEAIINFDKLADPAKVYKIRKKLMKKKRFQPSKSCEEFLNKKRFNFLDKTCDKNNLKQFLREYILNRLFENKIKYMAKGGSAIENYASIKRSTRDIDIYCASPNKNIIDALAKNKDDIKFEVKDFNNQNFTTIKKYKRARMIIIPRSSNSFLASKFRCLKTIIIDIDYSLDIQTLNKVKKEFNVSPHKLWQLQRMYVPISRNMIIAEKIMSVLDSQNRKIWIAKDFMDIFLLIKNPKFYNVDKIVDWLKFKIQNSNKYKYIDYKNFLKMLKNSHVEKSASLKYTLKTYRVFDCSYEKTINFIEKIVKKI